jgi:hypothetical protein
MPGHNDMTCSTKSFQADHLKINFRLEFNGRLSNDWPKQFFFLFLIKKLPSYRRVPWRVSISRPIASISSVAGGDVTTKPRRRAPETLFKGTMHSHLKQNMGWDAF